MLIGIDGNEANVNERVGIDEYAFELLVHFSSSKFPAKQDLASRDKFQIYLKNKPREDMPKEKDGWKYHVIGPKKLWTQFALPLNLYIARPRPTVFFTPSHYAPRFSPIPTVISIMDLSYIHFPEMFKKSDLYQLRNWTAYSVRKAKKILTISQASKDDIIKEYQVAPDKIVVTYPGIKSEIRNPKFEINSKFKMQNSKLLKEKYGIDGDYILFVGTLQPRKNLLRLIEAFAIALNNAEQNAEKRGKSAAQHHLGGGRMDSPEVNYLVIVGKKGWMYEDILEAPKKFGIENRVRFLDFVPDEDLVLFYQNAICFVLPSLYEGFGLPVLEAMQYGCPVITSNVSSLPEAGGDAALYVNPEDVSNITDNLRLMLEKPQLRKELIKKGYQQVKKFSWEKTARETLKVLKEVVKR